MLVRSPYVYSLLALGSVAALAGVAQQHHLARELRAEAQSLRAEERQLAGLRAEHDRLTAELADNAEPASRSDRTSPLPSRLDSPGPASMSVGAGTLQGITERAPERPATLFHPRILSVSGMKPVSEWANVGRETPQAALETQSWAFQHGDFVLAAKTLTLDNDTRGKVNAFLHDLEPAERAKYESPEQVVALLLSLFARDFSGVRFAQPVAQSSNEVLLWTLWTYQDGHSREHDVHLKRSAEGWQRVISDPEDFIANSLAQLGPKTP